MSALPLSPATFPTFFLIAVRCVATLMVAPLVSARPFPVPARIALGLLLALVLAPTLGRAAPGLSDWAFAGMVVQEVLVGLVLGFTAQVIFQLLHLAASLIEMQMGLTFAGLIDPTGGGGGSVVSQYYGALAALVFLAFEGHHTMLLGLSHSLSAMPLGEAGILLLSPQRWIVLSGAAISSALQLALPVAGALLLADIAMAMLARSMPQVNLLITAMPAKIGIGLAAIAAAMPVLIWAMGPRTRAVAEAMAFVLGGR